MTPLRALADEFGSFDEIDFNPDVAPARVAPLPVPPGALRIKPRPFSGPQVRIDLFLRGGWVTVGRGGVLLPIDGRLVPFILYDGSYQIASGNLIAGRRFSLPRSEHLDNRSMVHLTVDGDLTYGVYVR